jgi:hypothetical protein
LPPGNPRSREERIDFQTFLARTAKRCVVRTNNLATVLADQPPIGKDGHPRKRQCSMDNELRSALLLTWFRACLRGHCLFPVIGRQRYTPNVSWLSKFNPALQRVLRIDVNNPSSSSFVRHVDVNRDSHSSAQPNCRCDQRSIKADNDSLAIACPTFITFDGDYHLQRNASTSSRFVKRDRGGH